MKLNDNALTPLYQQVLEDIKAKIAAGHYLPGMRIPSEAELSGLYSVSRVTIRRAIEELVGEGYLTKRQGKGTYVNQRKMTRKIRQSSAIQSFTEVCAEMGMTAGAHVLECSVVPPTPEEQLLFGEDCKRLVYLSRVRTADGIPIMEEHNLLPYEGFSFLLSEPMDNVSFFSVLLEKTGRIPNRCAISTIEITLANAAMAQNLAINAGDPLFYEHVFFVDQDERPFCLSNKYLVGARYQFDI